MENALAKTDGTITARMARWAAGLEYSRISDEAVHQAKRFLSFTTQPVENERHGNRLCVLTGIKDQFAADLSIVVTGRCRDAARFVENRCRPGPISGKLYHEFGHPLAFIYLEIMHPEPSIWRQMILDRERRGDRPVL